LDTPSHVVSRNHVLLSRVTTSQTGAVWHVKKIRHSECLSNCECPWQEGSLCSGSR